MFIEYDTNYWSIDVQQTAFKSYDTVNWSIATPGGQRTNMNNNV